MYVCVIVHVCVSFVPNEDSELVQSARQSVPLLGHSDHLLPLQSAGLLGAAGTRAGKQENELCWVYYQAPTSQNN